MAWRSVMMSESLKGRLDLEASGLEDDNGGDSSVVPEVTQNNNQAPRVILTVADQTHYLDVCEVSRSNPDPVLGSASSLEIEAVLPSGGFKLALAAISRDVRDFTLTVDGFEFSCSSLRVFREREVTRWSARLVGVSARA